MDEVDRADTIDAALRALPRVEAGRSRFGEADAYFVDGREFAHFERGDALDLRLTRSVISRLRPELKADPRVELRKSPSDWVVVRFSTPDDLPIAIGYARTAYDANRLE